MGKKKAVKKKKAATVKALEATITEMAEDYTNLNQRHLDLNRRFFLGLINGNRLHKAFDEQVKKTERFERVTDELMGV